MQYVSFEIENFKGIQRLQFDLLQSPSSPVYLLVGLNESGKTTILESLSFYYDNLSEEKELTLRSSGADDIHDLIPKGKKDNFNDRIKLSCRFKLEENDINLLRKFLSKNNARLETFEDEITVTMEYHFQNSQFERKRNLWHTDFRLIMGRQQIARRFSPAHTLWGPVIQYLKDLIPPLIYYPNFLFDFPDKIYLDTEQAEDKKQAFYCRLLQDVLDSIQNNLKIDTHIVSRVKSDTPQDRDACESVINKMGAKITQLLVHEKFSIFKNDTKRKEIIVTYPRIEEGNGKCYVELKLKEGQDSYYIRERSLGFRWFFTFLLFTQFRVARLDTASNLFFLFDEPASNLHQSSQRRLLNALENLTDQTHASVIYSTHSHHMINPKWLESTFIVRNIALDYENEDEYTSSMTNIKIERYRTFVANNPTSTSYYQPVLDVLEYRPSNLEYVPNIALVEGKNDYYTLSYFNEVIFSNTNALNLCPGSGSGSLDNIIRLYYAWGKNFVILLDADTEGITQKKRYHNLFGKIIEDKIYCLNDIDSKWKKKGLERLINDKDRLTLQQAVFPETTRYRKKSLNIAIQELLVTKNVVSLNAETKGNFKRILAFLNDKLSR